MFGKASGSGKLQSVRVGTWHFVLWMKESMHVTVEIWVKSIEYLYFLSTFSSSYTDIFGNTPEKLGTKYFKPFLQSWD